MGVRCTHTQRTQHTRHTHPKPTTSPISNAGIRRTQNPHTKIHTYTHTDTTSRIVAHRLWCLCVCDSDTHGDWRGFGAMEAVAVSCVWVDAGVMWSVVGIVARQNVPRRHLTADVFTLCARSTATPPHHRLSQHHEKRIQILPCKRECDLTVLAAAQRVFRR